MSTRMGMTHSKCPNFAPRIKIIFSTIYNMWENYDPMQMPASSLGGVSLRPEGAFPFLTSGGGAGGDPAFSPWAPSANMWACVDVWMSTPLRRIFGVSRTRTKENAYFHRNKIWKKLSTPHPLPMRGWGERAHLSYLWASPHLFSSDPFH